MNTAALFDKLLGDLASAGAVESAAEGDVRELAVDGEPFARLQGDLFFVRLPADEPAGDQALGLRSGTSAGPEWVRVDTEDVAEWPRLAERALRAVKRED